MHLVDQKNRFKPVTVLQVKLWGKLLGFLRPATLPGYYAFQMTDTMSHACCPLWPDFYPVGQPTVAATLPLPTYKGLPAFIADGLPDDFGQTVMNQYFLKKQWDLTGISMLDRLAYMGSRGMGALSFEPETMPLTSDDSYFEIQEVVEASRRVLSGKLTEAHALESLIAVGTSAGGARAKAVVAWNPTTNEIRCGQFDVGPGFEHWLLKFDGVDPVGLHHTQGFGRIEFAYAEMAKKAGIAMSPCHLLEENGRAHFMTQRFDRYGNERVHMLSLCAMAHLDFKQRSTNQYSQWFHAVRQLALPASALEEVFRRMVFNVLTKNCDDHTKNVSFLLHERHTQWQLAPAYDITFAYNPTGFWTHQHLMAVNGKFTDITEYDLVQEGVRSRIAVPTCHAIIAQVRDALAAWPAIARNAGVPQATLVSIQAAWPSPSAPPSLVF